MLPSGALLHERYRILRPIGRGGMGAVYEALDSRLQNTVAVKQMTVGGPDADRAFENEAKLLAALRHGSLPVVIDYFVESVGQFLVMQYIEGEDLEQLRQAASPDDVLKWALALLDALAYLHTCSPPIVHRDIKPANLKRTPRGEIVLLDFGLAKGRADSQTKPMAEEKSLLGFTLKYAPIEQIEGRGTDPRSDVYALGATLYHLATGVAPPSALQRSAAKRDGRPDPLREAHAVNARVSEAFSRVLARALELEPAGRFTSAVDMRAALLEHESVPRVAPQPRPADDSRRIDAAMPSQAEVGSLTDLIVQVRFADSPRLGLEDWPARRYPSHIEQRSEPVKLMYPRDPGTGSLLPAELRIKIVAPDFKVEGQSEQLIEVPPNEYSRRVVFLLAPQRAGYCRVNVEVYDPAAFYLGTIAVEAEAVGSSVAQPLLRVAYLVLGVFARQVADAMHREQATRLADRKPPEAERLAEMVRQMRAARSPASGLRRALFIAPIAVIVVAIGTDLIIQRQSVTRSPASSTPSAARDVAGAPPLPASSSSGLPPAPPNPAAAVARGAPVPAVATSSPNSGPTAAPPSAAAPADPVPSAPPAPATTSTVSLGPPPAQSRDRPPERALPAPISLPPNVAPSSGAGRPEPPSASPALSDEAAIRVVLREYVDAYSRLDAGAVKRVFPSVDEQKLSLPRLKARDSARRSRLKPT